MDTGSEATVPMSEEPETHSKDEEEVHPIDPEVDGQGTLQGAGLTGQNDINSATEEGDVKSSEKVDMSETDESLSKVEGTDLTEVNLPEEEEENYQEGDSDGSEESHHDTPVTRPNTVPLSKPSPAAARTDVLERAGVLLKRERGEPYVEGDITSPTTSTVATSSNSVQVDSVTGTASTSGPNERHVRFADDVDKISENGDNPPTDQEEPANLLSPTATNAPGIPQVTNEQLLEGITYQAQYLGSTPVFFTNSQKTVRMQQAREAVKSVKDPDSDTQPRIDIDLRISTKALTIIERQSQTELIVHPLKTVSYVADIENCLVVMAHRALPVSSPAPLKLTCHILETEDPREVAMVIGLAFSSAYKEFLKSHGVEEESMEQFEYQHVLSSQTKSDSELNSLKDQAKTKEITFAKHKGEILGLIVIDSGYGSAIPSCIVAHLSKTGAACRCSLINVGDQILSINGVSLVGMPLKVAIDQIKKCRPLTLVKMVTCKAPAVVDVTIMRPDLKYQLGFSVKEGTVCSLYRGSIAERSGIRVGHRIIEINGTSTVGISHDEMVHMLATTVGDLHIRTMPAVMYQILTGQITPEYF